MTQDRRDYFVKLCERLGISTMMLIAIGYGMWELAHWTGPRVDRLVDKHVEIVDKAMAIGEMNSRTLEKIGDAQESQAQILSEIHRSVVPQRAAANP